MGNCYIYRGNRQIHIYDYKTTGHIVQLKRTYNLIQVQSKINRLFNKIITEKHKQELRDYIYARIVFVSENRDYCLNHRDVSLDILLTNRYHRVKAPETIKYMFYTDKGIYIFHLYCNIDGYNERIISTSSCPAIQINVKPKK